MTWDSVRREAPAGPPTIEPSRLAWPEFGDSDDVAEDSQRPQLLNAFSDPHNASATHAHGTIDAQPAIVRTAESSDVSG